MTVTISDVPAGELSAMGADGLQIYSRNLMQEIPTGSVIWRTGFTPIFDPGSDVTDPDFPVVAAFDSMGVRATKAIGVNEAAYSLLFNVPFTGDVASKIADSLIIRMRASTSIDLVRVTIAHDAAFTTGPDAGAPMIVAEWTSPVIDAAAHGRLFARFLGKTGTSDKKIFAVASGGYWVRIAFQFVTPNLSASPEIFEMFWGRRRVLSFPPNLPWDDDPRGVDKASMTSKNRTRQRYIRASGFRDYRIEYTPTGVDGFGLDDLATLRQIWDDSLNTQQAIWFVHGRDLDKTYLCEIAQDEMRNNLVGYVEREGELNLDELPVFANETNEFHQVANEPAQTIP